MSTRPPRGHETEIYWLRGFETARNEMVAQLAAETARADAAERLAERYRVALEDILVDNQDVAMGLARNLPVHFSVSSITKRARQALASAPEDVSRKGDNFDTKADGLGQHPDGFCSKCGSWSLCKCSEGER